MMKLLYLAKKENCNSLTFQLISFLLINGLLVTNAYSQKAIHADTYISAIGVENSELIKSLLYENLPSLIIAESQIQMVGEGFPQKVISDANSVSVLKSANSSFRTAKLLQINLNNEAQKASIRIQAGDLKGFSNLAYIFISSEVSLSKEEVERMVTGYEEGDIILLYMINTNF